MKKNILALCALSFIFFISTDAHADTFAGGDGSVGNPYQIETCVQLQSVKDNLTSNFILNNNINCYDTINWNGGNGFTQIGSWITSNTYTGIFDGQYYTIDDLYLAGGNTGLFGAASGTIQRFGLNNVKAYNPSYAYVGGAVGTLLGGTVSQVFTTGEITGISYTGGVVGWHSAGQITDVYSRAAVTGTYSGGIIGRNDSSTLTNAYATGGVFNPAKGIIGFNFGGTTVNSFYDGQLMGLSDTNGNSTPKTTSQMKNVSTFTATITPGLTSAWDFVGNPNNDVANNNIWNINPLYNDGYPYFAWQTFDQAAPTITSISSELTNGTYGPGSTIPVTITFSEPVTSTGVVTLTFETGATDRTCTFSVILNNTAICNYVVQAGDLSGDLDVTNVVGVLADRWGNAMTDFVPGVGLASQKALVIDVVISSGGNGGWIGSSGQGGGVDTYYLSKISTQIETPVLATSTFTFGRDLKLNTVNGDVKFLQQYLNANGYTVSKSGPGSKGFETTKFGPATRVALIQLQKFSQISATGFFGPVTRGYVNSRPLK